ncbi:ribosome assembly factor SBDS [Candidatus Woesearchaeota archaeon]|nr:MAG: ribosome assembly factor SBDS [Candidatus Woesearchaeota archaeon]
MKGPTFDQERIHVNLCSLKKGGETFELVVDPDKAVELKERQGDLSIEDVREVLRAEKVFSDAKKGLLASETHMREVFGTSDPLEVAKVILKEGNLQITQQFRDRLREEKKKRLVHLIHINSIDPRTGNPHPEKRIELAFEEARVRVDEFRKAEDQIQDVLKKLREVLPIRFERSTLTIHLPSDVAPKLYSTVQHYATIVKEEWLNDGSWRAVVELPAGLRVDFIEELNSKTQGRAQVELVEK